MDAAECYIQKVAAQYEFCSTQIDLPADVASIIRRMASEIPSEDLVRKEFVPHITLLYGLHGSDPQAVKTLLASESPVNIRFGKTEVFHANKQVPTSPDDYDVVYVKVLSPDLRRLNRKLRNHLPHTATHPKYVPHATVAYVKKGKGYKYAGRSDLENQTWTIDAVRFSQRGGRKTTILLKKAARDYRYHSPSHLHNAPVWMAAGGLGGAGVGRYLVAPVLSRLLGLDPKRARRLFTILGAGAGVTPGAMLGLVRRKTHGSFFSPGGAPQTPEDYVRHLRWALGKPRRNVDAGSMEPRTPFVNQVDASGFENKAPTVDDFKSINKTGMHDPMTWSRELWDPSFPVATSMDDVTRNPLIPIDQKVKMRNLIAQSGREQGVGITGAASAGALIEALPKVVRYAVPTVGGAWLASKALGAPRRVKNTAMGAALVYSTLKGFMEKGSKYDGCIVPEFRRKTRPPDPENRGVSEWYKRAILAALDRPFADFSLTLPMQDYQWRDSQKRHVELMEHSN